MAHLSPAQKIALNKYSLPYYTHTNIRLETGDKFLFENHEYLHGIYKDTSRHIVIQKSTQMGASTYAFIRAVHGCQHLYKNGVGYFFPTKTDVTDFSKTRIEPFLKHNKQIIVTDVSDGLDTDNVSVKRIGNTYLYLRGMKTDIGVKSIPLDFIIFDELDEADPQAREKALRRVDHSEYKHVLELSNPTIENYGINKSFLESDQKYYFIKCTRCGHWTSLDAGFPRCIQETGKETAIRICGHCKKELDIHGPGEWVAKSPRNKDISGYLISQLYSHYIDPYVILNEYRTKRGSDLETFYRMRLGKAYTLAQNRITREQVLNLVSKTDHVKPKSRNVYLGVDQGSDLHCVLIYEDEKKIYVKDAFILTDFEDIDKVIARENVRCCVIDALPETRKAKELKNRNKGIVFLNFYIETVKGNYKWNDETGEVQTNRTESLDFSQDPLTNSMLICYNNIIEIDQFADHCANMARKLEENEETGSKRYVWVKTGPDHFRHSLNYAFIARSRYGEEVPMSTAREDMDSAPNAKANEAEW